MEGALIRTGDIVRVALVALLLAASVLVGLGRPSLAEDGIEVRIAEFWKRVDALRPSDHLAAADLGQWATNVTDRDATARISVADFRVSTAHMQTAIESAGRAAVPISAPANAVEQRIAAFWTRINALWPSDFVSSGDLGRWALNVIERDAAARLTVADFRASTAGMQGAMDRARASLVPTATTTPAGTPTVCAVAPRVGPPYSCRGATLTRLAPGDEVMFVFDGFSLPTQLVRGGLRFPDGRVGGQLWPADRPHVWGGPYTTWWWHTEVLLDPKESWASGWYSERWTINGARYEIAFDVTGNGGTRTPTPVVTAPVGTTPGVSPSSGRAGTSFQYVVVGFAASEGLVEVIRFPDGTATTRNIRAEPSGQYAVTIVTDRYWAPGVHTITVTGVTSRAVRTLTFTITP